MRLERQTREHHVALAEADQKLLQTQEELDKVGTNQGEMVSGREMIRSYRRRTPTSSAVVRSYLEGQVVACVPSYLHAACAYLLAMSNGRRVACIGAHLC